MERRTPGPAGARRIADSWLVAVVGAGIGLRLAEFAHQRGFWVDEARIAVSVLKLTFRQLLGPILFEQGAPFGFLALAKLSSVLFGSMEWALRLPSLVAGIVSCLFIATLASTALSRPMARLVTLLFAISPWLTYYAGELKPYVFDLTVVLGLGIVAARPPAHTTKARLALVVGGAAAPWLSIGSLFGLAGLALVLAVDGWRTPRALSGTKLRWLVATLVAWGVSVLVAYRVHYVHFAGKRTEAYWAECFMPPPWVDAVRTLHWLAEVVPNEKCLGGLLVTDVPAVLVWGGVAGLCLRFRRPWALYWCGVLAAAFGLSALGTYSLANRLALFLVPGLLLGLGAAIECLAGRRTWVGVVLTLLLLLGVAPQFRGSSRRSDRYVRWNAPSRELMLSLSSNLERSDRLWVQRESRAFVAYYLPRYAGDDDRFETPEWFDVGKLRLAAERGDRIWVVDAVGQRRHQSCTDRVEEELLRRGARREAVLAHPPVRATRWVLPPPLCDADERFESAPGGP